MATVYKWGPRWTPQHAGVAASHPTTPSQVCVQVPLPPGVVTTT